MPVSVGPAVEIVVVDATIKMMTIEMVDGSEQKGQFPTKPVNGESGSVARLPSSLVF